MEAPLLHETVGVRTPDGTVTTLRIPVKITEDDIEIARRVAGRFSPGTVVTVDGTKFKVVGQEPAEVIELTKPVRTKSVPPPEASKSQLKPKVTLAVQIGQRWVTKDSRRKQEPFEVTRIEGDAIVTDKGARIGLHRMNRYQLVS